MSKSVVNVSSSESDEEVVFQIDEQVLFPSGFKRDKNGNNITTDADLERALVEDKDFKSNADDLYDNIAATNTKGTMRKGLKRKSEDAIDNASARNNSGKNQNNIGIVPGNSQDRVRDKASAAAEKEAKKQKLLEEKAARKAANENNKIYKPGECMKHMQVEGHPNLWSRWYMSDVSRELAAAGARAKHDPGLCDPALLVWTRVKPRTLEDNQGQLGLSQASRCRRALYVSSAEEVSALVSSHALSPQLAQARQLADASLTLLLYRPTDFFKKNRRQTSNSNRMRMTEIDLELAITDLMVSANCDTVVVNTPNELALFIAQFTKAIAEAPFKMAKRECDEQAQFYMRGDNKKCVALDKDGVTGMGRLWQQMLAVLPQSSLDTSRALCAKYPTPLALYQALQSNDLSELASLGVSRAAAPGSRARRVGPEFARKLHALFTQQRGDTLIDDAIQPVVPIESGTLPIKKKVYKKASPAELSCQEGHYLTLAYATANSYDLKSLKDALLQQKLYEPGRLKAHEIGNVVVANPMYSVGDEPREIIFFGEGGIAFWNCTELEANNVLDFVRPFEVESYPKDVVEKEREVMTYVYQPNAKKCHLQQSSFVLMPNRDNSLERYTFSKPPATEFPRRVGVRQAAGRKNMQPKPQQHG
ncbi:unnamed protein product [Chrysodeixis includens]|uniref:DUF155 domain-containing protein n=1 Tax=Chrysodeixis includens TaxID=689277 RepID=A0A9N8KXG0_CHRIL|nr:unnamed protein product [Chrysodeixis includens]